MLSHPCTLKHIINILIGRTFFKILAVVAAKHLYRKCAAIVADRVPISKITELKLFDRLIQMKYDVPNDKPEIFDDYSKEIDGALAALTSGEAVAW